MTTVNLIELIRFYIDRMIQDCGETIKAIIMDKETVCDTKDELRDFHSCLFY